MIRFIFRLHIRCNNQCLIVEDTLEEFCKAYLNHTDESLKEYKEKHWTDFGQSLFNDFILKLRTNNGMYTGSQSHHLKVYHLELFTIRQYEEYRLNKIAEEFIPPTNVSKLWDDAPTQEES